MSTPPTRTHSRFAPSSLERVLACPRSVALAEAIGGEGKASVYAAEGSVAHMVAEACLSGNAQALFDTLHVGQTVTLDGYDIVVTQDMHDYGKAYAKYVEALCLPYPGSSLYVEQTVRLDHIVGVSADMYGHLDAAVWLPDTGHLHVIDYKYGKGVAVSALDNPQLKAYALGAVYTLADIDPDTVKYVHTHVYQPRHIGWKPIPDTIPMIDLLRWGYEELRPITSLIQQDGAVEKDYVTGDHCRWCPALAQCPAMRERATKAAQRAFGAHPLPPSKLSTDELADALDEVDVIEPWFEAARKEGLRRAVEDHDTPPRRKLVDGRRSRVWRADVNVPGALFRMGLDRNDIYEPECPRSVAQVEKAVERAREHHLLTSPNPDEELAVLHGFSDLFTYKAGKPTLAPSSDPRPTKHVATAGEIFGSVPLPTLDDVIAEATASH